MKKIIGVVLVAVCVLLVGCGQDRAQTGQEKVVEQQQQKKEITKQNVMGDGNALKRLKPGESIGGL